MLPGPIVAIETGTFQGDTSALLAGAFGRRITIERSAQLARDARARFANDSRVTALEGSSQNALADALPQAPGSGFLWLDAHRFYDFDGADTVENPLLTELELVMNARSGQPCVIAVGDTRGMGVQPDWPSQASVCGVLEANGYAAAIIDDVLVAAPRILAPDFYALYGASRVVEVSAVFHIWSRVVQLARLRSWSNRSVVTVKRRIGR